MEIKHSKTGVEVTRNEKTITFLGSSVSERLSGRDLKNLASIWVKFYQAIGRLSKREINPDEITVGGALNLLDFENPSEFVKYISYDDYQKYYSKGIFRLGTSQYYRNIENEKSKDGFEGFNISVINVNHHQLQVLHFRSNDHLILCGSEEKSAAYNSSQFGNVKMKVKDVLGFSKKIQDKIGAVNHKIGNVIYSNARVYNSRIIQITEFNPNQLMFNHEILNLIIETSLLPSLFVKPLMFTPENETRIVFEMPVDMVGPYDFEYKELLEFIEFE